MKLAGKVAIVTGAASGFGRAIAERFALEGASVVAADINGQGVSEFAGGFGDKIIPVQGDVSQKDDIEAMVRTATEAFGAVDIVVNNAGITHRNRPMLEVSEVEFDRIFAVNVKSIYLSPSPRCQRWKSAAAAASSTSPPPPAFVRVPGLPGTTGRRAR